MQKPFLSSLLALALCSPSFSQSVIANWTFENLPAPPLNSGPYTPESGSGSFSVHNTNSSSYSFPAGNGSDSCFSADDWSANDYYELQFSTSSLSDISLSFDQSGSGYGPGDFKIQYSSNGTTYTDLTNGTYALKNTSWVASTRKYTSNYAFDLSSITAINNLATAYIRIVNTGTTSISGGTVSAAGTNRIDNILVTAGAGTYYYKGSSSLAAITNWGTNTDGSGTNPASLLIAANTYHIGNATTITMTSNIGFGGAVFLDAGTNLRTRTAGNTFSLNNSASLEIASTGRLTVTSGSGTYDFNDRPVTFKSDVSGTASLDSIPSGGTVSGATNVTIERYIPARRAWRLLAAPLDATSAPTIYNSWQEAGASGVSVPGYGTWVTSAGTQGAGFDAASTTSSLRYYNASSDTYATPANTNSTKVTDNTGAYMVFVRGDRTKTGSGTANTTTLRMTGTINTGNITCGSNVAGSNFTLVPNPYPSPVDFEAIYNANNALTSFYVWDAQSATYGGFRTVTRTGVGTYTCVPTTGSDNDMRYIQSSQAFFINGTANGGASSVAFTESMKVSATPPINVFKTTTGNAASLSINLEKQNSTGYHLYDGVAVLFDTGYSANVTNEDIHKINNFNENIAIKNDTDYLAIERRPFPTTNDTVSLYFWNFSTANYQFQITPNNTTSFSNTYLLDNYLNTTTSLSTTANSTYSFSINSSVAGSYDPHRFSLVFANSNPLQLTALSLSGNIKNKTAQLQWKVINENGVGEYILERSQNEGRSFEAITTQKAKANDNSNVTYAFNDAQPHDGNNLYRIKSIGEDASVVYGNTISLHFDKASLASVTIFPNPANGNKMNLYFENMEEGKYNVSVYNSLGELVLQASLSHTNANSIHTISFAQSLAAGVYQLQVTHLTSGIKMTQSIMCQ